jgi:thiol-disulfide isomerase/thioredoxin
MTDWISSCLAFDTTQTPKHNETMTTILRLRGGSGAVEEVSELELLTVILESAENKLAVIDFTASWCGPCQRIAPMYKQLAEQTPGVIFLKVCS